VLRWRLYIDLEQCVFVSGPAVWTGSIVAAGLFLVLHVDKT
jgi:hypothetical protein